MESQLIAERKAIVVDPAGSGHTEVTLVVYAPIVEEDGVSFCTAAIDGLEGEVFKVGGVDTLQSLLLALSTLQQRFDELRNVGYEFLWPGDERSVMESLDYADVASAFGSLQ